MIRKTLFFTRSGTPLRGSDISVAWKSLVNVSDGSAFGSWPDITNIGTGLWKTEIDAVQSLAGIIKATPILFEDPTGIAVSATRVFVCNGMNHQIQVFDLAFNYLFQFGGYGTGNGQFSNPYAIAVDALGNPWVVDSGNNRIQHFDADGNFVDKYGLAGVNDGEFQGPLGIAITGGLIYIVDAGNSRVQVLDMDYVFQFKFGSAGAAAGQFNAPWHIAVNGANIFVSDMGNNRVQKFDLAGNYVSEFGTAGAGDGEFSSPEGIVLAAAAIYVADMGNNRVQKFNLAGVFQSKFGSHGTGDGQFQGPWGMAIDASNIYVTDDGGARIEKFDLAGTYITKTSGFVLTDEETYKFLDINLDAALEATSQQIKAKTDKMLFDASGYIKSTPQTAVTVSPAQALGGALQPLLPIKATATIEAPQGDAYPIPWALGSAAAKTDAKFIFIAKTNESDSDAAAAISQEITIADPANVAGMNVLTTAMTAAIASYHAKVKRVDADGLSNPLTVWKGRLNVVSNVG